MKGLFYYAVHAELQFPFRFNKIQILPYKGVEFLEQSVICIAFNQNFTASEIEFVAVNTKKIYTQFSLRLHNSVLTTSWRLVYTNCCSGQICGVNLHCTDCQCDSPLLSARLLANIWIIYSLLPSETVQGYSAGQSQVFLPQECFRPVKQQLAKYESQRCEWSWWPNYSFNKNV